MSSRSWKNGLQRADAGGRAGADRLRFLWAAWALATLVTALVGPFETHARLGFPERIGYWGGLIAIAMAAGFGIRALTLKYLARDGLRADLIAAALQAVVLGSLFWWFNLAVLGFAVDGWFWYVEHVAVVFAVCLGLICARLYLQSLREAEPLAGPEAPRAPVMPAPIARALDMPEGTPLLRISADGHHLRIVGDGREGRVRMRFADAMELLEEGEGYRIHRSHWIARHMLSEVRADGRRHVAVLRCGTELPVSRSYLEPLRRDGFID